MLAFVGDHALALLGDDARGDVLRGSASRRALARIAVAAAAGGQEHDLVAGRDLDLGRLLHRRFGAVGAMNDGIR